MSDTPRLVVAIGLPGSGKSTYFTSLGANPVSSDALRRQLADDESDQSIHARVFALLRHIVVQRIELQRPVSYVDATNLTRRERKPYIRIARERGCRIEALWFDTPLSICRQRNNSRNRVVPDFALELMAAKLVPPSIAEGFASIDRRVPGI